MRDESNPVPARPTEKGDVWSGGRVVYRRPEVKATVSALRDLTLSETEAEQLAKFVRLSQYDRRLVR